MQIGEVAAAAAGHQDFAARFFTVIQQQYPAAALAGLRGAKQTRGPGADDDAIKLFHCSRSSYAR